MTINVEDAKEFIEGVEKPEPLTFLEKSVIRGALYWEGSHSTQKEGVDQRGCVWESMPVIHNTSGGGLRRKPSEDNKVRRKVIK